MPGRQLLTGSRSWSLPAFTNRMHPHTGSFYCSSISFLEFPKYRESSATHMQPCHGLFSSQSCEPRCEWSIFQVASLMGRYVTTKYGTAFFLQGISNGYLRYLLFMSVSVVLPSPSPHIRCRSSTIPTTLLFFRTQRSPSFKERSSASDAYIHVPFSSSFPTRKRASRSFTYRRLMEQPNGHRHVCQYRNEASSIITVFAKTMRQRL